ncbi:MAG: N-acetyltransferase [Clostridia bacterium]|nr:N-acetyltransferase [Clostridia bacterium]
MAFLIRPACQKDAGDMTKIYRYYVENTAITFDTEPPTEDEIREKISDIQKNYPYLVIEEEGRVTAFAYAHAYKQKAAYDPTVELTVYTDHHLLGKGRGRAIILSLLEELKKDPRRYTAIADITSPNERSEKMFLALGFQKVSVFPNVGYKFGTWQTVCDYIYPLKSYE